MTEVLIIGAGPAGLATAAMLERHGLGMRLVDRTGAIGGAYARLDPTMRMTSPAALTALPGAPVTRGGYFTVGEYLAYLTSYARGRVPEPREIRTLRAVGPAYELDDGSSFETVVVASGVFEFPVRPAIAGTPTVPVIHARAWVTEHHARPGSRVLIVGGATSAVEIAEHCARRGCITTLAARHLTVGPQAIAGVDLAFLGLPVLARLRPHRLCAGATVPAGDRGFAALRRRGALAVHRELVRLDGARATLADGHRCEVDLVVLATGYRHEAPFLPVEVARTARGLVRCRRNESVSHRGIFVVGAPCARSGASQYLYGIARDAEAVARTIAER